MILEDVTTLYDDRAALRQFEKPLDSATLALACNKRKSGISEYNNEARGELEALM